MDKIKAIKIRNADGTYTDEIPISIDASYVNTTSGEDAQSTLDSLSENINSLKDSIDSNTSNITINTNSINTLTTQVSSQEEQVNDLSTNLDSLKVNIEELTNEESTGRVDILEINQDDLTNRITTLEDGSITAEKLSVEKLSDITPYLGVMNEKVNASYFTVSDSTGTYYFYPLSGSDGYGYSPYWKGEGSSLSGGALYLGNNGSSGSTEYEGSIRLNNKKRGDYSSSISSNGIYLYGDNANTGSGCGYLVITSEGVHLYNEKGYYNALNAYSGKVEVNNSSGYATMSPTQLSINGTDLFYVEDNQLNYKSGLLQILSTKMQYTGTSLVMDNITSASMSSLTSLDIGSSVTTSGSPTITIGNTTKGAPNVYIGATVEVSSGSMKVNQSGLTVNGTVFQVTSDVRAAILYASSISLGTSTSIVSCMGTSFSCSSTNVSFTGSVTFSGDVSLTITDSHIDDNSISGEKITDGTITLAKMADGFADSLLSDETYVSNTESIIANTSTLTADDPIVENLSALISVSGGLSYTIVDSTDSIDLTVADADNYVYMVPNTNGVDGNLYDEYMVINGAIEKVGDWSIDLNDYATKTYVDNAIDGYITTSSISATTTGAGNVITSASYDSTTGTTTYNKDITALTESDIEEYTADEINALYALIA